MIEEINNLDMKLLVRDNSTLINEIDKKVKKINKKEKTGILQIKRLNDSYKKFFRKNIENKSEKMEGKLLKYSGESNLLNLNNKNSKDSYFSNEDQTNTNKNNFISYSNHEKKKQFLNHPTNELETHVNIEPIEHFLIINSICKIDYFKGIYDNFKIIFLKYTFILNIFNRL